MNTTRTWLLALQEARRPPTLDLALLTDRGAHYVRYRVQLIGVRALLRTAVHIAEVWFLAREFPFEFLVPLFALRAVPSLLAGLHWGALEALRERIRREVGRRNKAAGTAVTEAYLLGVAVLGLALSAGVYWLIAQDSDPISGVLGLYGLFAIVVAAATAIELWTRTYHAGIFALGRVYRPAFTMLLPDGMELIGVIGLWPYLGPFCLHAVVLAGAVVRGTIATVYATKAYGQRAMPRPRLLRFSSLSCLGWEDAVQASKHLMATIPMQLDRLLLLILLQAPPAMAGSLPLGLPYYALRPIAGFAHSWARAFYPDLVRLDVSGAALLRERFERLLHGAALATGALGIAAFAAGAYALFSMDGLIVAVWLAPIMMLRSRLAVDQLRGFVYGAYARLALLGVLLLGGLVLAAILGLRDRSVLILVTVTLLCALVITHRIASDAPRARAQAGRRLPLAAWLFEVASSRTAVRLCIARVDSRIANSAVVQSVVANALAGNGHVTRIGRAWLLWWEPLQSAKHTVDWARELAGAAASLIRVDGTTGSEAIEKAVTAATFPHELTSALSTPISGEPCAWLHEHAARLLPTAESIDLQKGSAALRTLSHAELAIVRRAIFADARQQRHSARTSKHQVAVYAPGGEPQLIFLWSGAAAGAAEFRRAVTHASWRASLQSGRDARR